MQQPLQRLAGELRQIRCAQQHGIHIPGIFHAQMNGMGHTPLDLAVQNGLKARFFRQRIDRSSLTTAILRAHSRRPSVSSAWTIIGLP